MMTPDEAANVQALSLHAIACLKLADTITHESDALEDVAAVVTLAHEDIDAAADIIARHQ